MGARDDMHVSIGPGARCSQRDVRRRGYSNQHGSGKGSSSRGMYNVRLLNVQDLMLLLDTVAVVSSSVERIPHKTFPRIVVDLQFQVALD